MCFCTFCDWKEICENEWIDNRHLNQALGNNKKNIKKLNNAGIQNLDELAKLNPKTKIEGLRDEIKIKRINQAKLQIEAENKGYPIFKVIEEYLILNKGFNLLPKPSECDLFFDLEGVQDYVFPGKLEYLFGPDLLDSLLIFSAKVIVPPIAPTVDFFLSKDFLFFL